MIFAELILDPAWDLRGEMRIASDAGWVALLIAAVLGALALIQRKKPGAPRIMRTFWLFFGCGIALLALAVLLSHFHKGPIFDGMKKSAQPFVTANAAKTAWLS